MYSLRADVLTATQKLIAPTYTHTQLPHTDVGIRVVIGLLDGQLSGDTSSVAVDCDTVLSLVRQCTILACENLEDDVSSVCRRVRVRVVGAVTRQQGCCCAGGWCVLGVA